MNSTGQSFHWCKTSVHDRILLFYDKRKTEITNQKLQLKYLSILFAGDKYCQGTSTFTLIQGVKIFTSPITETADLNGIKIFNDVCQYVNLWMSSDNTSPLWAGLTDVHMNYQRVPAAMEINSFCLNIWFCRFCCLLFIFIRVGQGFCPTAWRTLVDARLESAPRTSGAHLAFISYLSSFFESVSPPPPTWNVPHRCRLCLSAAPCFMSRRSERQRQSRASKAAGDI